jgi:hypothetical protein
MSANAPSVQRCVDWSKVFSRKKKKKKTPKMTLRQRRELTLERYNVADRTPDLALAQLPRGPEFRSRPLGTVKK